MSDASLTSKLCIKDGFCLAGFRRLSQDNPTCPLLNWGKSS